MVTDIVEEWIIERFAEQGFNTVQIVDLLYFKIDHHETENLLQKGCSHELALEILGG